MITCQVGKNKIDTFSYKEKQLREWSDKGLLKCPVCGSKMIYHHGEFKIPHFKHSKNNDCPDIYSEGVTEEHIKGIEQLHNWLKTQGGVAELELEKWIPETKQRPDIYFKYRGEEYAIEFQCSPIATKFLERRDLYRLNGIKDIWILGCEKYDMPTDLLKEYTVKDIRFEKVKFKTLEREILTQDNSLFTLVNGTIVSRNTPKNSLDEKYNEYKTFFDITINNKQLNDVSIDMILNNVQFYEFNEISYLEKEINAKFYEVKELLEVYEIGRKDIDLSMELQFKHNNYYLKINETDKSWVDSGFGESKSCMYRSLIKSIDLKEIESIIEEKYMANIDRIVVKNEIIKDLEILKDRYQSIKKNFTYKIKYIDNYGFNILIEIDYEDFTFVYSNNILTYSTEEVVTRAFTGKRGGVGFSKNWVNVEKKRIEYDKINYQDILDDMKKIICNRLRSMAYSRGTR